MTIASNKVCGIRLPFNNASGETKGNIQIEGNRVQKRRKKLLNAVQNALNDPKEFCEAQQRYIGSKAVLLSALIEAAGKLDFNKRQSFQDYRELAHRTELTRPYEEAVEVFLKSKGDGNYRAYCSFGCMHRAAQIILRDLLRLHHSPKSWQYGVKGRGVREAVKRVRALYAKGYRHCAVLDVKAFYDCFHHAYILSDKIPGPHDLKKTAGIGRYYQLEKGETHKQTTQKFESRLQEAVTLIRQKGLPQGSAFSVLAAQYVMSNMEIALPKATAMLNYVDDFLCCAKSAEKLNLAEHALHVAVAAIPAGKFELLAKSSGSIANGFEYLGHHFFETPDGNLRVAITEANGTKWTNELLREQGRLEEFIAKVGNPLLAREWLRTELEDFAFRQICWLRTFSEADDIDEFHEFFNLVFDVLTEKANFDAAKLLKAAKQKPHQDQGYLGIS